MDNRFLPGILVVSHGVVMETLVSQAGLTGPGAHPPPGVGSKAFGGRIAGHQRSGPACAVPAPRPNPATATPPASSAEARIRWVFMVVTFLLGTSVGLWAHECDWRTMPSRDRLRRRRRVVAVPDGSLFAVSRMNEIAHPVIGEEEGMPDGANPRPPGQDRSADLFAAPGTNDEARKYRPRAR